MNKNDLRFQKTETAIKEAYKSLKKKNSPTIKVKELCEKAEINKTNFYCHYESMDELHREVCRDFTEQVLQNSDISHAKKLSIRELVYAVMKVCDENRGTFENLYGNEMNHLVDDVENSLMRRLITPDMDENQKTAIRFCIGGGYRLLVYDTTVEQVEKVICFVECVFSN